LKLLYAKNTSSIIYAKKDLLIKTLCEKLLLKGFESIHRKDKE